MAETLLTIAGVTVRVAADHDLLDAFLKRAGGYVSKAGPVDLALHVHTVGQLNPASSAPASSRAVRGTFSGGRFQFWRRDFRVQMIPSLPAAADAWCEPGAVMAVENVLRACLSTIIPLRGDLMLHASGVACDGMGFVFTGQSGTGKSTIVKLLSGQANTLSLGDEVTVISTARGEVTVHSTPFGGELDPVPPGQALLRRLFFLDPSRSLPDAPSARAARLLRNALVVVSDPSLGHALVATAQGVVGRADCRAIFRPTAPQLRDALSPY